MKFFLTLISCYLASAATYLNEEILNVGLDHILQARHLSSYPFSRYRYSKRGISKGSSNGQRELAKGSRKAKKATPQQGKAAVQQQGKTEDQKTGKASQPGQADQQSIGDSIPKPGQSSRKSTSSSPSALLRAEVEITRGPADIHTVRGIDLYEDMVPSGDRRRRIVSNPVVVAAGGKRRVNQPANAASQPNSQHAVRTVAQGPVAETTMRIPPGGKGHVAAEIPGRERQSWDIPGQSGTSVLTAESDVPEPARMYASVTDGSFVEAGAFPRSRGRFG